MKMPSVTSNSYRICKYLAHPFKGTISDRNPKLYFFFPNPQIFLHIQRELQCNNLPIQHLSRKQHIFGKRDNSLLLGIQASVSIKRTLDKCNIIAQLFPKKKKKLGFLY